MDLNLFRVIMFLSKNLLYAIILQTLGLNLLLASNTTGQKLSEVELSIHLDNVTLEHTFKAISAKTDFHFVYDRSIKNNQSKISLNYQKASLEVILKAIAEKERLQFRRINYSISVKKLKKTAENKALIIEQEKVISGKVINKKTKAPLPYASIIYQNKSTGTVANSEGDFTFSMYEANESDSLLISYLGYKPLKLTISKCLELATYELLPKDLQLKEVVVTPKKIKLKAFIKDVISDYNKHRRKEPHIAIAHYREKAKENDKYIMYMESIGYSVFGGRQANAAKLSNYKFFYENTKCHISKPEWMKYKKNSPISINEHVFPSGGANLNVFRYLEIHGLLSKKHYSKYKYEMDSTYHIGNNEAYCIKFKGKIAEGTLHVFAESKQIVKIECTTDSYWSQAFFRRLHAQVNIEFNYFDKAPFISAIHTKYEHQGLMYQNDLEVLVQKFDNFKLNNEEYWSLNRYDHEPYIEYDPIEWRLSSISKDEAYDIIEKDLTSGKYSLEQHFEDYSGQWLFADSMNQSQSIISLVKRLKQNF